MRVAIYARVSTKDKGQDAENQLHQLRAFAERHDPIYRVFLDQESGGKADRSAFKQLLDVIAQVQRLKASGPPNQAIARALKMSPSTVAKYLLTGSK